MTDRSDKARSERMQRLKESLEKKLSRPAAAIEALTSELQNGEAHPDLWEELHAAAQRDGVEADTAEAYRKITSQRRMERLSAPSGAELLTHAANYFQGVLGDADTAEEMYKRVLGVVPDRPEVYAWLARRFERNNDARGLVELYGLVASAPPTSAVELAGKAMNTIMRISASTPVSDGACRRLARLAHANPKLLDGLESHCRKTGRLPLARELFELVLEHPDLPTHTEMGFRRRVVELYLEDASTYASAISHVEILLEHDAGNEAARAAANKLLSNREVASRAAAALHAARRKSMVDDD